MSSQCYWCIDGKPAYGNQLGTMGEPFANCSRCNVFCCGHHGQRDNGAQKFYCFDCDKTILIVSAIRVANVQETTVNQIINRSKIIKGIDFLFQDFYKSFDDFLSRKPGYSNYFEMIDDSYIDYESWSDPVLMQIFLQFPREAQKLLIAAAIIIADTNTEEELKTLGDPLFLNLKTSIRVPVNG